MSATVRITSTPWQDALLRFIDETPLSWCTSRETRADDSIVVTTVRPPEVLSSGEQVLWRVLESMCSGDLYQLFDRVTEDSVLALGRVIKAVVAPQLEPTCGCGHTARQHSAIGCGANIGMGSVCRCGKSSGTVERDALDAEQAAKAPRS